LRQFYIELDVLDTCGRIKDVIPLGPGVIIHCWLDGALTGLGVLRQRLVREVGVREHLLDIIELF
jgi:hypothetical protein